MLSFTHLDDNTFKLTLPVNLDFEMNKTFQTTLREILAHKPKTVIFDFSDVDYIDSAGLGMLMLARQESVQQEFKLKLAHLGEGHPRQILEMVKFDQLFNIEYVS